MINLCKRCKGGNWNWQMEWIRVKRETNVLYKLNYHNIQNLIYANSRNQHQGRKSCKIEYMLYNKDITIMFL